MTLEIIELPDPVIIISEPGTPGPRGVTGATGGAGATGSAGPTGATGESGGGGGGTVVYATYYADSQTITRANPDGVLFTPYIDAETWQHISSGVDKDYSVFTDMPDGVYVMTMSYNILGWVPETGDPSTLDGSTDPIFVTTSSGGYIDQFSVRDDMTDFGGINKIHCATMLRSDDFGGGGWITTITAYNLGTLTAPKELQISVSSLDIVRVSETFSLPVGP